MSTQELSRCHNPFFTCKNTNKELKIQVDIQVKNEKYEICECCWPIIAESENYQWTQPRQENNNESQLWKTEWKHTDPDTKESEED